MNEPKIIYNAIRCPDGTVLESKHSYDYQEHTQEDGRKFMVDGGCNYLRRSGHGYEEMSVTTDCPHEKIRNVFTWTSILGKDGNELPEKITRKLFELENDHVMNLIAYTSDCYPLYIHKIFVDEAKYRGILE